MNNKISRNIDETDESFMRRKWFINEMKPKTKHELNEAIRLSNIWVNTVILGCVYPILVMNKIKKILEKSSFTPLKV